MENPSAKKRIFLIDEIRGFCILCMVVYHAVYNILIYFSISFPFFYSPLVNFLQHFFAGIFIFISGIACHFSKNNRKRGFICFGLGMLMTAITVLFVPQLPIYFGILHFLGCSMIIYWLIESVLNRMDPILLFAILIFLFFITYYVPKGLLGPYQLYQETLPSSWYQIEWLFPIGIKSENFYSADYFPLIPWIFLFLAGSCFGKPIKEGRFPAFFYHQHNLFLNKVGRHTLWIYLLHQPILFGLLWVYSFIQNVL